ncbi:MAG: FtsH protease activity modulator HflK [Alcanivorax sp.]|jgi:membrane protease subunit HflK|uniref:FtsH protease activity modulator HflK n=1 Tax=Thalassolituus TaxID=187492 RepID=UPI0023F43D48|nr:FtsH protease activity modulator HflK [Thalassolituus oleivorans]|tara:strand:- start:17919 stop:18893 length:975 start_codon:yes stop_codon:yes gene_type:complete
MSKAQQELPDLNLSPKTIVLGIVAAVVLYLGYSSYYTVSAESVGVLQRFGHYHRVVEPGLHFKIPFGVDTVIQVPIKRQLKEEFGFGTPGATFKDQVGSKQQWALETTIVTGDLNTALVEWVIQFRIENAFDFLFKVRDPGEALRDISESVMREVVGDRTVDEVLTIGRQEIETNAQIQMQKVVNLYEMGLRIDQVQLKNVNPPKPVQASFDEVNEAQQERERMINVARGEYNKAVPRARGTADQNIQGAQGYAIQRVNEAQGDASKFDALLAEYIKAPKVTERRLYLETMAVILPNVEQKIILDAKAGNVLPLLNLDRQKGAR